MLSTREREVLCWLREGKNSWDIGMILEIKERTVNFHVDNIKRKLCAVTRAQAVAQAMAMGVLKRANMTPRADD